MKKFSNKLQLKIKEGFTLLEMLVVIGIISILIGLGVVSYSTAQKKARDAKRRGDLNSAQKVMEQCNSVNNYQYPTITNSSGTLSATCPAPNTSITFSILDPLNNTTYKYTVPTTTTSTYTMQACLEGDACANPITVSQQQ